MRDTERRLLSEIVVSWGGFEDGNTGDQVSEMQQAETPSACDIYDSSLRSLEEQTCSLLLGCTPNECLEDSWDIPTLSNSLLWWLVAFWSSRPMRLTLDIGRPSEKRFPSNVFFCWPQREPAFGTGSKPW